MINRSNWRRWKSSFFRRFSWDLEKFQAPHSGLNKDCCDNNACKAECSAFSCFEKHAAVFTSFFTITKKNFNLPYCSCAWAGWAAEHSPSLDFFFVILSDYLFLSRKKVKKEIYLCFFVKKKVRKKIYLCSFCP